MSHGSRDWRELAEAAGQEQDPEKLRLLIVELCKALEEGRQPESAGMSGDHAGI